MTPVDFLSLFATIAVVCMAALVLLIAAEAVKHWIERRWGR